MEAVEAVLVAITDGKPVVVVDPLDSPEALAEAIRDEAVKRRVEVAVEVAGVNVSAKLVDG
jgi:hypothetical protein